MIEIMERSLFYLKFMSCAEGLANTISSHSPAYSESPKEPISPLECPTSYSQEPKLTTSALQMILKERTSSTLI